MVYQIPFHWSLQLKYQCGGKPTMLGRTIGEFGRIFSTIHNLTFIDYSAYRHKIFRQLNRVKSRHSLARAVIYGKKGEK